MSHSPIIKGIIDLGAACNFEGQHASRVSTLALRLFDDLQRLHRMGNTEKIWLRAAALLHDIGKSQGAKRHHKVARDIILNSPELPLRWEERVIVALVARYHRGARPRQRHAYFGALDSDAQRCVAKLAALLRLADGLDKGRAGLVGDVRGEIHPRYVLLQVASPGLLAVGKILRKAHLFETIFGRRVTVRVEIAPYSRELCLDSASDFAYAKAV